jgi:hypothetical protein
MAVKTSYPQVWHSAKPTLISLFLFGPLSVETIIFPKMLLDHLVASWLMGFHSHHALPGAINFHEVNESTALNYW